MISNTILVAHDFSDASTRAAEDASQLAFQTKAELVLAYVQPPGEESADQGPSFRAQGMEARAQLESFSSDLRNRGIHSRVIVRTGSIGDTLFELCCERKPRLLFLGAYGYGARDREQLGSTAENLLRAIACPAVVYGPGVSASLLDPAHGGPTLVPISSELEKAWISKASDVANVLRLRFEVCYVSSVHDTLGTVHQHHCIDAAKNMVGAGLSAECTILQGKPWEVVVQRSNQRRSPTILMPLKWGHRLSSMGSDNVAARIIRNAPIPVITLRED